MTFKYKDYRIEGNQRYKTMTLDPHEFIRRFLIHVLPKGFHRIRHYGLFANADRTQNIARARELLSAPANTPDVDAEGNVDADNAKPTTASLPVLRWPHVHHRNLRTRRLTTKPADQATTEIPDRHVMTTIAPSPISASRFVLSAALERHEHALARIPTFGRNTCASASLQSRSIDRMRADYARYDVERRSVRIAAPTRPMRPSNPHSVCRTLPCSLPALSFFGGFRTPAAGARRAVVIRPASETLHRSGHHTGGHDGGHRTRDAPFPVTLLEREQRSHSDPF